MAFFCVCDNERRDWSFSFVIYKHTKMNWIIPTWVKYTFLVNLFILLSWCEIFVIVFPWINSAINKSCGFYFPKTFLSISMQLHFLFLNPLLMYHFGSFFSYFFNTVIYSTLCLGNLNFIRTWWWWRNKNRGVLHTLEFTLCLTSSLFCDVMLFLLPTKKSWVNLLFISLFCSCLPLCVTYLACFICMPSSLLS